MGKSLSMWDGWRYVVQKHKCSIALGLCSLSLRLLVCSDRGHAVNVYVWGECTEPHSVWRAFCIAFRSHVRGIVTEGAY